MGINRPRRPASLEPHVFDRFEGGGDPALTLQIAHDTASALIHRVKESDDPEVLQRVIDYAVQNGVGELAELWAQAPAHSLPGALWRLYLVHGSIVADSRFAASAYERGTGLANVADAVIAGASQPTTPADIQSLAQQILTGAFTGEVGDALDRAAAYCRIQSRGITDIIGHSELENSALLERALTLSDYATDFTACAKLDRKGQLH